MLKFRENTKTKIFASTLFATEVLSLSAEGTQGKIVAEPKPPGAVRSTVGTPLRTIEF